jgi:hypothetical protein
MKASLTPSLSFPSSPFPFLIMPHALGLRHAAKTNISKVFVSQRARQEATTSSFYTITSVHYSFLGMVIRKFQKEV